MTCLAYNMYTYHMCAYDVRIGHLLRTQAVVRCLRVQSTWPPAISPRQEGQTVLEWAASSPISDRPPRMHLQPESLVAPT